MGARCSLIHLVRTCDMKAPCKLGHIESPVAIVRRLQVYTSTRAIFVYWVACLCDRSGIYQPYSPILGLLLHSKSWTRQPQGTAPLFPCLRFQSLQDQYTTACAWPSLYIYMYDTEAPTDDLRCVPLSNCPNARFVFQSGPYMVSPQSLLRELKWLTQ